uniref:Uncharacterized protein n=1 Tax=Ananas comosus var. bracteatus TaxID=296719 RepID=A0A6V7QNE2_ANACO|nr:unnamed protein product [Ananas comosus var. bracteatus]
MAIRKCSSNKLPQGTTLKQILKRCSSLGRKQGVGGGDDKLPKTYPKATLRCTWGSTGAGSSSPSRTSPTPSSKPCFGAPKRSSGSTTTWVLRSPARKSFSANSSPPQ